MLFTPLEPRAGPTGGLGEASPAPTISLTIWSPAATFLAMVVVFDVYLEDVVSQNGFPRMPVAFGVSDELVEGSYLTRIILIALQKSRKSGKLFIERKVFERTLLYMFT